MDDKQSYRFLAVLDFEATCQTGAGPIKPQEIIEFPVMVLDSNTREVGRH